MRFEGKIKSWNDDRGFGFIAPAKGGQEIFMHIKAFPSTSGRPAVGDKVSFEIETIEGKERAAKVRPMAQNRLVNIKASSKPWSAGGIAALCCFGLSYFYISVFYHLTPYVGLVYLVMSIICAGVYWFDKDASEHGDWRIQETTLLMLGLLCGWPGAIVAQNVLQHKTTKATFQRSHWGGVILNLVLLFSLTTPFLLVLLQLIGFKT